jgi:hypothetical protein
VKGPSPLLGYNNNVRHKGRVFHIQTEDSGVRHPHVITHLFMDGGRIVKSLKTSYAQHLEDENGHEHVRALMKQQHQAMFRDLRDGKFDYALTPGAPAPPSSRSAASLEAVSAAPTTAPSAKASVTTQPAISSAHTEPAPPPDAGEEPPPVVVAPASPVSVRGPVAPPAVIGVPPGGARVTDPSAQTMPDLRAAAQPPASAVPTVRSAAPPPSAAVRSDAAPAVAVAELPADEGPEKEPSSETSVGDSIVFTAIDEYDPEPVGTVRRRTPPPRSDLPPPPAATLNNLNKSRPDGAYRSQVTPTPPPPRGALGSRPAASRPPVGSPSSQAPAPTGRRSLFGDDYVSEKSLDEVILSYLAEDLDTDK